MRQLVLSQDAVWRRVKWALFAIAIVGRLLVQAEIADHPIAHLEEWPGSEPWYYATVAQDMVISSDLALLKSPTILVSQDMAAAARGPEWRLWSQQRLPRGAIALWLLALSHGITSSPILYKLAALMASGMIAFLAADAAARLFGDRRIGVVAGIIAASQQSLAVGALVPGPWIWEALATLAVLCCALRVRDDARNPAEWLLAGLVVAAAAWLRPMFWWGVLLVPAAAFASAEKARAGLVLFVVPLAISSGLLAARNSAAGGSAVPVVGFASWDFYREWSRLSLLRPVDPKDLEIFRAAGGSLPRTVSLWAGYEAERGTVLRIGARKVREWFGARDEPRGFNPDFMRRRSFVMRWTELTPDVTMAAGWASLVFLLFMRRLPRSLFTGLALVTIHGLIFGTGGMDRLPLHAMACILCGAGLVVAWDARTTRMSLPFMWILAWAAFTYLLKIDDHARGTRMRGFEFSQSANMLLRSGQRDLARAELKDLKELRAYERNLLNYWYMQ